MLRWAAAAGGTSIVTAQIRRIVTASRAAWAASLGSLLFLAWLLVGPTNPTVRMIWLAGAFLSAAVSYALARRDPRDESWWRFLGRTWDVHALGLALLYWLAVQQLSTMGITSDGSLYFAHFRSLLFDADLQIDPELMVLMLGPRPHHVVAVGPAVVWAPLYLAVAGIDWLGLSLGAWTTRDPDVFHTLTGPYARAALIGSFLMAAAGLFAIHVRLRREFGNGTALVASLLLFGATPLVYYAVYEPAMTHAASFGIVALFLVTTEAWMRRETPSPMRAVMLGVLIGLAFLVRPQNALFGIFAIACAWPRATGRAGWRPDGRALAWLVAAALPFVVVQVLFWSALLDDQSYNLVGDRGYLRLLDPHLLDVLFSSWHGLFSWTPVAYVAVVGALFYVRRDRIWGLATLGVFLAMWWINASADDWSGGVAFGGRRFTSTLAALAPGLALAVGTMWRRPLLVMVPLVLLAIQWNDRLMTQYNDALISKDQPVSFGTLVGQQAEAMVEAPLGYPFAFPANAWFAWRHGVPIDRYDLLSAVPFTTLFNWPSASRPIGSCSMDGMTARLVLLPRHVRPAVPRRAWSCRSHPSLVQGYGCSFGRGS